MKELSKKQIQKAESKVLTLVDTAESFIVEDVLGAESASEFLRKIKDTEKKIEAKRLEFTAPLNQSLKAINTSFKKLKEPLANAKKVVSDKILAWRSIEAEKVRKEEEARRKSEEEKIRKIQETCESEVSVEDKKEMINEIVTAEDLKPPIEKLDNTVGNTQARKIWSFEVIDFAKVPDEYKEISQSEVRASIREGERNISGLKIYQKEILAIG